MFKALSALSNHLIDNACNYMVICNFSVVGPLPFGGYSGYSQMAQTRTVCLKVFEIIVYLICAVFFIAFFFNDQIDAYLKGQYSLANGFVKVKALEFPTITMCMKPGRKLSSSLKYNLQYYDGLYMNDFGNSTLIEVYNESSYELGRDFDIFLNSNPQNKVTLGEFHFGGYEGYEEMANGTLDVLEVRTLALGKCYALVPHSEIN